MSGDYDPVFHIPGWMWDRLTKRKRKWLLKQIKKQEKLNLQKAKKENIKWQNI